MVYCTLTYFLMSLVEVHRFIFLSDILSLDEVTEPTFCHRVPVCIISVSSVSVVLFLIPVSFPWDISCAIVLRPPLLWFTYSNHCNFCFWFFVQLSTSEKKLLLHLANLILDFHILIFPLGDVCFCCIEAVIFLPEA